MKGILIFLFSFLSSFLICAQSESKQKVIISEDKTDDLYITGESIDINAAVFGNLIAALLITHYLNRKNTVSWNFSIIAFITLLITTLLHTLTLIQILGFIISLFIIALSYGVLISTLLPEKI